MGRRESQKNRPCAGRENLGRNAGASHYESSLCIKKAAPRGQTRSIARAESCGMSGATNHNATRLRAMSILSTALQDMQALLPTQMALDSREEAGLSHAYKIKNRLPRNSGKAVFYSVTATIAAACAANSTNYLPNYPRLCSRACTTSRLRANQQQATRIMVAPLAVASHS